MGEADKMTVSTFEQLRMFLLGAMAGAACGALSCFFKALRQRFCGLCFAALTDFLFWLLSAAVLIWTAMSFGGGEIRCFQIIAAVCAGILYVLCLGRLTVKLFALLLGCVGFALRPAAFLLRGMGLYIKSVGEGMSRLKDKFSKNFTRASAIAAKRKKIRKNYKKML